MVQVHPGPPMYNAAIPTFLFQGSYHQKTVLPKICQKFEWAIDPVIRAVPMRDPHETSKVGYGNLANLFDPRYSF